MQKEVKWGWSKNEEKPFLKLKKAVVSDNLLIHYDEKKSLVITVDASSYGNGAVALHVKAEKNYVQIEMTFG